MAGSDFVIAGANDSIVAGTGTFYADIRNNLGLGNGVTIDLSSNAASTIIDESVSGGVGSAVTVTGFDKGADTITSATSVAANTFIGLAAARCCTSTTVPRCS